MSFPGLKKLASTWTNFNDDEIDRIMGDSVARNSFSNALDCYKMDDQNQRTDCIMKSVLGKTCKEEFLEFRRCITKKKDFNKCYVEISRMQACLEDELYNVSLVAKGYL